MTRVDCDDCSMNFQTKKLYIKHLKSKECTKSKHASPQGQPAAKKPRIDSVGQVQPQALQESLLKVGMAPQNTAQYSQKQMEVLQSQITQLSQKQKELLQAQITQKQRQVLQAIPYNQLSEKQKEILKRLSAAKPVSPPQPTVSNPVLIRPNPGQAVTLQQAKDSRVEQNIKKGRRKNVYNKIPELKNGQIVKLPSNAVASKAPEPPKLVESEPIIKEFVFSDDPIAAESIEIEGEAITMVAPTEFVTTEVDIPQNPLELSQSEAMDTTNTETPSVQPGSKVGSLKIKTIANAFHEISNIVAPTATPKETCPHCKKIFSKAGILQHIETKHKVKCDYCDLRFLPEELQAHIDEAHMAPCPICKEKLLKDSIEKHVEHVHKEECVKCKVKFLKTEIKVHIRTVHEAVGCDDCENRFETEDILKNHIEFVHLTEKCEECTLGFKTNEELEEHTVEVHPKEYCEEDGCDAVFGTTEQLDEHKEKIHPNPNKFVSFNGGMFMMMMVQDDKDEEEQEVESENEDDTSEDLEKEIEEEKASMYEFLRQMLIDAADDIVKTAMTGKILFSVRFEEQENVVEDTGENFVDPEDDASDNLNSHGFDVDDQVKASEEESSVSDTDPLDDDDEGTFDYTSLMDD